MTVESALYPQQLNTAWPQASDMVSEGDNHIRLTKTVIKTTFPNVAGVVSATDIQLSYVTGVTSPIQSQIDSKGAIAGQTWTGTHVFPSTTTIGSLTPTIRGYLETVTSDAQAQFNARSLKAGDTYSGTHNFTGAAVTVPTLAPGATGNGAASVDYANALAFSAALPGQAGNAGKFVKTNGAAASWASISTSDLIAGDVPALSINGGQLAGMRNKIINGHFGINQRNYASGAATTAGQYTFDRWKVTGTGGVSFSTTANKTTVTIPSGQTLQQVVEGLHLESGTYVLSWEGTAQGRINAGAYGASGTVTAAITGGTNTTIEFNAGTVALVMFEKSTVVTPFEYRPHDVELLLCYRYYYRETPGAADKGFSVVGQVANSTSAVMSFSFKVPMRVAPTSLEHSGTANQYSVYSNGAETVCSSVPALSTRTTKDCGWCFFISSSMTTGSNVMGITNSTNGASAYLGWSAEL